VIFNGKEACYVGTISGVGIVVDGEKGYYPTNKGAGQPLEACQKLADKLNKEDGVDPGVAEDLQNGSMFGFHTPAAGRFRTKTAV